MISLISLLVIIVLSISVIRVGAAALELTGLSPEVAAFQAQSAFSGAGFTTSESESIVSHPLRRRITRVLILLGSAGLSSSIATLILTFLNREGGQSWLKLLILVGGIALIYALSRSRVIYRFMRKIITRLLERWTELRIVDYQQVLGLSKGYTISRMKVKENSWMSNQLLKNLRINLEGAVILALYRVQDGEERFIGAPTGDTVIRPGDTLICYSRNSVSRSLHEREKGAAGDLEHHDKTKEEQSRARERELRDGFE